MEKWEIEYDRHMENMGVYGYPVLDWPEEDEDEEDN